MEGKKKHWYEIVCEKLRIPFLKIPMNENVIKEFSEKLKFCDFRLQPNDVYTSCISILIIGLIIALLLGVFHLSTYALLIFFAFLGFSIYILYYPSILTKYIRIKASPELVLSILYMIVSLRIVSNLEVAVKFAAKNLTGPVGRDLKRMLWGLSIGIYLNAEELLDDYAKKWKKENLEFCQAIGMIKSSMREHGEKREKTLDEAINVILKGNMERMKHYSSELRNPLTIITMLGITLPMLTVVLFPIMTIFLTEEIKPAMLVIFYNIILPILVYYVMSDVLRSMPLQFRIVDISLHPEAHPVGLYPLKIKGKKTNFPLVIPAILIGSSLAFFGSIVIALSGEGVTLMKLAGGLIILWGIALSLIVYSFFSYYRNLEIRKEIKETELEFDDAMYQLGHLLYTGQPVEKCVEKLSMSTGDMKIGLLFKRTLENIRRFGLTFKRSLFDEKMGVVKYYPSHIIRSMLSIAADSTEKGLIEAAKTMIAISKYLKTVHLVEENMREILDETTSDMRFMLTAVAPISCGIVVGLATIMIMVLFNLVNILSTITGLSSSIPSMSNPIFIEGLVDIKRIVPAEWFLVIVGVYMLETIILLSMFLSTLQYGGDPLEEYRLMTSGATLGMLIFSFSILLIYFIFGSIIKLVGPI